MNDTDKIKIILNSPIFSSLAEDELAGLAKITSERRFNAGATIFFEGDTPEWFYIVAAGRVKAFKQSSSGKEFTIAFFNPGEIFGEVAVFENKPYPASAAARSVGETVVLGIRRTELLAFLASHPGVALRIISVLGERLRNAQSRLGDMAGGKGAGTPRRYPAHALFQNG
jgi:CRP-like cAMP-binding protein